MLIQKINNIINFIASYYQNTIGISIYNGKVYVVEIKKVFGNIKLIKAEHYDLKNDNFEDNFRDIKKDFELNEKPVSINLYNSAASFKLLKIPKMPENEIETWLKENPIEFLPTGVSFEDIELNYKIVRINHDIIVLLGFVKKEEVEHLLQAIYKEENIITRITPGLIDLVGLNNLEEDDFNCTYITNENYHELVIYNSDHLVYYNQIPQAFQNGSVIENIRTLFGKDLELLEYEPGEKSIQMLDAEKIQTKNGNYPVNIEYLPAYFSALSVINGESDSINFLPGGLKENSLMLKWKQAFLKFSISVGTLIFILYFLAFISVFFLGELYNGVENERAALAPNLSQIQKLRSQKNILIQDLSDAEQVQSYKSQSSILLTALGYHIPKNCWLTSIDYNKESEKSLNTVIKGMSKDKTIINTFLANLESDKSFKIVKLDYINRITRDEVFRDWKIKSSNYLEFQISVEY